MKIFFSEGFSPFLRGYPNRQKGATHRNPILTMRRVESHIESDPQGAARRREVEDFSSLIGRHKCS